MPLSVLRTTTTFNVPSLALDNAQRLLGDKSDGGWAVGNWAIGNWAVTGWAIGNWATGGWATGGWVAGGLDQGFELAFETEGVVDAELPPSLIKRLNGLVDFSAGDEIGDIATAGAGTGVTGTGAGG